MMFLYGVRSGMILFHRFFMPFGALLMVLLELANSNRHRLRGMATGDTKVSVSFPCVRIVEDLALDEAKEKNFVFSPCSIQLALSLVANGSRGSTLNELLTFVEAKDLNHLNSVANRIVNILTGSNLPKEEGPVLSFAGGIWVDDSLSPLNPSFTTVAESIYKGKAEVVNFKDSRKAKQVLDKVNEWAENATNGLIKSVLPEGAFGKLTRAVLANAL